MPSPAERVDPVNSQLVEWLDLAKDKGHMLVIGLTGGIGTGKTEVSRMLEDLGAEIINADLLGHEAYIPQTETWRRIVDSFGEGVLTEDGEVDRKKLGALVFGDPGALERLNAIMFPPIYQMVEERLGDLRANGDEVAVVEAALFVEANWTSLADELWVTAAPEDLVIKRVRARTNLDEGAVRDRIRSQMPQEERLGHADVVIENGVGLDDLRERVHQLWHSRVTTEKESRLSR